MPAIGFKIDARATEDVLRLARSVEAAGFSELWVCEDLALAGGIAQVAGALAVTSRLEVGLGIAPAAVRNPMYLAMEFASVARLSSGRFHAGIGHGMPAWLTQVGQHPVSLMACLREVSETVRDLLDGKEVTYSGEHVHLDSVSLTHPPTAAPATQFGCTRPEGHRASARSRAWGDLGGGIFAGLRRRGTAHARPRRPHHRVRLVQSRHRGW